MHLCELVCMFVYVCAYIWDRVCMCTVCACVCLKGEIRHTHIGPVVQLEEGREFQWTLKTSLGVESNEGSDVGCQACNSPRLNRNTDGRSYAKAFRGYTWKLPQVNHRVAVLMGRTCGISSNTARIPSNGFACSQINILGWEWFNWGCGISNDSRTTHC